MDIETGGAASTLSRLVAYKAENHQLEMKES